MSQYQIGNKNLLGVEGKSRITVDTYRFMLIEAEDEEGFYGHATQRQTHQQEQQPLGYPGMLLSPPLIQPWWQRRLSGMGVHHIHSGIMTLCHAYRTFSQSLKSLLEDDTRYFLTGTPDANEDNTQV